MSANQQEPSQSQDDAQNDLDEAAISAAFEQGFSDQSPDQPQDDQAPAPSPAPAAAAPAAPAPAAKVNDVAASPAPSPAPAAAVASEEDDPFAGLHPKVKDMLARTNVLAEQAGRVPGLQSRLDKMGRELEALRKSQQPVAAAPAPAPASSEVDSALDLVAGELPEVADLVKFVRKEIRQSAAPSAPAAPSPAPADDGEGDTPDVRAQAAALAKVHPNWDKTMVSTGYQLWLATQPAEYQSEVQNTDQAVIVSESLTKYRAHEAAAVERARAAQSAAVTNRRMTGAAQPAHRGQRPSGTGTPMTEEEALLAGFNSK